MTRISVVMATCNGASYVKHKNQIDSLLNVLSVDDEIIVSDDSSTDATISVVESINDSRIVLLAKSTRLGYQKNFRKCHFIRIRKIHFFSAIGMTYACQKGLLNHWKHYRRMDAYLVMPSSLTIPYSLLITATLLPDVLRGLLLGVCFCGQLQ